jgi:4-hydroxyacetophenone monooxygenase
VTQTDAVHGSPDSDRPVGNGAVSDATDQSRMIEEALEVADLNALRVTLLQLTGDPELRDMPLESVPIRNGRVWVTMVHRDHQDRLKDIARDYLLRDHGPAPAPPDRTAAIDLLQNFVGRDIPPAELPMALDSLALSDFPRDLGVSLNPGVEVPDDFHVTIIGAGISGMAMAIYLQRAGLPFTIVDRAPRFGGTWVINHYPRLRIDVSGYMYQYSFAPYKWRSQYPSRAEIIEYADWIADRYDLRANARLSTSVQEATWDAESARWTVRLSDGTAHTSNFVVSASGLFNAPNTPNIPGLAEFGGKTVHTAAWDDGCSVDGKTVALIGNGSSGTQLMPWLADHATKLFAFQRTAQWIVPPVLPYDSDVAPGLHWLFENLPFYHNWHVYAVQEVGIQGQLGHEVDPEWFAKHGSLSEHNDALRASLEGYIREQLEGRPDLIEKSIPKAAPLSRRLIVDNGWYKALKLPNVELVTDGIVSVDKTGINTRDGKHYDIDVLVLGSGFEVSNYFWPVQYRGEGGRTLEEAWRQDGARAYLGMSYPDFPNFFSCYGPNSHPRSGGFHSWTESWARYVTTMIVTMLNAGSKSLKVKREPFEAFNDGLDEEFKKVVWGVMPSGGYYINPQGRPGVHMPYRSQDYYAMLAEPKFEDYDTA